MVEEGAWAVVVGVSEVVGVVDVVGASLVVVGEVVVVGSVEDVVGAADEVETSTTDEDVGGVVVDALLPPVPTREF